MKSSIAVAIMSLAGLIFTTTTTKLYAEPTGPLEMAQLENTLPGNAARGRQIVRDVNNATCLICHSMPIPEEPAHGEIGPPLHGVGSRYSEKELRLRLVDPKAINPETIMPSYYKSQGFNRVSETFRDQSIYTAQQIEDVVAYLIGLKDGKVE